MSTKYAKERGAALSDPPFPPTVIQIARRSNRFVLNSTHTVTIISRISPAQSRLQLRFWFLVRRETRSFELRLGGRIPLSLKGGWVLDEDWELELLICFFKKRSRKVCFYWCLILISNL